MKFSIVLPVAYLASCTLGSVLTGRTASVILNDIALINSNLTKVKTDVDAFQGGSSSSSSQVLGIQNDSTALDKALQRAGLDTAASAALSDSDSAAIANAVVTLQPNIYATLTSLTNKKNAFRTALGGSSAVNLVLTNIKNLRRDTTYFGANVTAKLSSSYARTAPLLTGDIDWHFQRTQDAFSTP